MSGSTTPGVYVELYVRSLAPRGIAPRQRAVIETLTHLRERDVIDDYQVVVCGRHIPATVSETATEFGRFLLDRVDVFSEWAERSGWSLEGAFARRTVDSSITGQSTDVLTLPVMALAEYEGDDLRFVAPVTSDETQWTVQDRLDALQKTGTSDTTTRLADARVKPPQKSPALH